MSSRRFLSALLLLAVLPSVAGADPVRITSGFLSVDGVGATGHFQLNGDNFQVIGAAEPGVVGPELTCFPCTAGDPIDLSTRYLGDIGGGSGTVDGTFYPRLTFAHSMFFTGPTVVAPSTPGPFTVTRPFTFDARLLGIINHNTTDEQTVFDAMLFGHGTVTASFGSVPTFPGEAPLFDFDSVRYDFNAADPVPEPASLFLLGTGLAAVATRHITRRRRGGRPI
jgi:hypothetical protein